MVAIPAENEAERLAALYRYEVLDTPPEASFDLITSLAAALFCAPISLISLVDPTRQVFKSHHGLATTETPRDLAFCAHAIHSAELMVVCDATTDARFSDNPLVQGDPHIRFYAGAPLETSDGFRLGTLCVLDREARPTPDAGQLDALQALARQVMELFELHRTRLALQKASEALEARSRELHATEARFSAFMEYNPCVAYIKDAAGRLVYANPQCEQLWRLKPGEWLGKTPEELWSPAIAARVRAMDLALLQSPETHAELMETVETPDGPRQFLITKFSLPVTSGVAALGGFAIDVTERLEQEESLRASERRYRELFARNPVPGWIYRTDDLRIVDVNQSAIEHYGWSRDEFLGKLASDIRMPGENEAVEAALRQLSPNQMRTEPYQHRRNQRSEIWIEASSIELEADGCPARLILANDVTERVDLLNRLDYLVARRTLDLEKSEARWRGLVEALPQFVWSTTADGIIDYLSHQWTEYTGVPVVELLGLGWLKTLHPDDYARVVARRQGWARANDYELEYRIRSKDGTYRWFISRGHPVQVEEGSVTQWLGTTTDIDDKKRSEERLETAVAERTVALEAARERAECAAQAKNEFLAVISHELRTPMNGVLGMAHLMEDGPLTGEQRDSLNTIQSSGQALLNLINEVLDFSKIEAGKMKIENAEFGLREVIAESLDLVSLSAAAKELDLSCEVGQNVPISVVGDAGRLRQVLLNLLSNAVKFTPRGSVRLSVSHEAARLGIVTLRFSVRDTGIGLSLEQQSGLFQPFSQADSSSTRRFGGTGLGLCIAKRLVELMGGTIGVASQLGQGSTFWFNVCVEQGVSREVGARKSVGTEETPDNAMLLNRFAGRKARVLVADDNVSNQQVAQGMLKKLGLPSDTVADGAEALAALAAVHYDLVLMDVRMPVMDGLLSTRQIRLSEAISQRHLPVIAMTASALEMDREKCLEAGMDDFVSKPVMPQILAKVLEKWLPKEAHEEKKQSTATQRSAGQPAEFAPCFDMKLLLRRLMGDRELANKVLDGFLEDMPKQMLLLTQFVEAGNLAAIESQAHRMTGASSSVGGETMRNVLFAIETNARAGDLPTVEANFRGLDGQFVLLRQTIARQRTI